MENEADEDGEEAGRCRSARFAFRLYKKNATKMIVCICNSIGDRDIRRACDGRRMEECDADDIMCRLGAKPQCGKCLCFIDDIAMDHVLGCDNGQAVMS